MHGNDRKGREKKMHVQWVLFLFIYAYYEFMDIIEKKRNMQCYDPFLFTFLCMSWKKDGCCEWFFFFFWGFFLSIFVMNVRMGKKGKMQVQRIFFKKIYACYEFMEMIEGKRKDAMLWIRFFFFAFLCMKMQVQWFFF